MSESKNSQNISLKKQTNLHKERKYPQNPLNHNKSNKNNKSVTTPTKENATPNKMISDTKQTEIKTNKKSENNINLKNKSHIKRNHSQLDVSSGVFDLQTNKNDNEFEQQIQNNQTNLSPGVAIGRDGKTPIDADFAKQKYQDMLTQYEMTEINDYLEVYFIGNSIKKKNQTDSFDDEQFHYKAKIGDHLAYRYEILSILGRGVFGTDFKCFDHKTKEKVSIKILVNTPLMKQQGQVEIENLRILSSNVIAPGIKAKEHQQNPTNSRTQRTKAKRSSSMEIHPINSNNNNNHNTHSNQSESSKSNSNLKHVVKFIDNFVFRNHICIVTEILGESLRQFMVRKTLSKPSRLQNMDENNHLKQLDPLPAQMVKLIAYQIMEGLASIHRKKIIHGDLKPENILFTNPQSDDSSNSNNEKGSKDNMISNSRKDSDLFKISYQPPQKITSHFTIAFSAIDNFTLMSQIKIIDFGTSCRQGELAFNYIQSRFYRAPEVVLGSSYGTSIDIWSAGCIIAELFVGKPLFPATDETDLLFKFIETLGEPPQSVIQMKADFQSKNSKKPKTPPQQNKFFGDDGRLLNVKKQPVPMKTRLTSFLKSSDTMMIDFLSKCLEWDKNKRKSAAKLLKHPWIAEFAKRKI